MRGYATGIRLKLLSLTRPWVEVAGFSAHRQMGTQTESQGKEVAEENLGVGLWIRD